MPPRTTPGCDPETVWAVHHIDGLDILAVLEFPRLGVWNSPQVINSSWQAVLDAHDITSVTDHIDEGRENRFEILWPALESNGTYRFPRGENFEELWTELQRGKTKEVQSYNERVLASGDVVPEGGVKLTKKGFVQWRVKAKSAAEIVNDPRPLLSATAYKRIHATIHGSEAKQRQLEEATKCWADQAAPAQTLLRLGQCLVTGYGNVHPDGATVLEESFANTHHARTRGLLHRCGETMWYSSVMDLQHRDHMVVEGPCIILKQSWDGNYGHWLVDNFARLAVVERVVDLKQFRILVNVPSSVAMRKVVFESLALLGIEETQVIVQGTHPLMVLDAWYPTPVSRAPLYKHPEAIQFLRGLVGRAKLAGGKNHAPSGRLYLSRSNYGKRVLLNQDEVVRLLEPEGYKILSPERLSFYDQVCTFGSATHVVGVMGAAFSNLVFCGDGVKVGCLATPGMSHDYFYDIACCKEGVYLGIQGPGKSNASLADDFSVDIGLVKENLIESNFNV